MPHTGTDPSKLEAYITNTGLSYKTTTKSYVFDCPLCHKPDKLYISRSNGRFVCWVCQETRGFRGAPEYALKELTGQPLATIKAALYGLGSVPASNFLDIRLDDLLDDEDAIEVTPEAPERVWPYHCLPLNQKWAAKGVEYLERRGVPIDIAMQYDIRYSPEKTALAFPMWVGKRLLGWQYRTVEPETVYQDGQAFKRLKVWSENDLPRNENVMFANRLTNAHAVLCEGPFDALKAHLISGNICTLGKAVSQCQIGTLISSGIEKLYVALDPDAFAELEPLLSKLDSVKAYKVEIPKQYKDLGDMTMAEAKDTIMSAQPLLRGRCHVYFSGLKGLGLV